MTKSYGIKSTAELPPVDSDIEYEVCHANWFTLFLYFLSQLGTFFGVFFGIGISSGHWPWWAFCFVGQAFTNTYFFAVGEVAKIVRHPNSFEFANRFGRTLYQPSLTDYKELTIRKGSGICGNCVRVTFTRTEEYKQYVKRKYCCVSCCIGDFARYAVKDLDRFAADHGLLASENGSKV